MATMTDKTARSTGQAGAEPEAPQPAKKKKGKRKKLLIAIGLVVVLGVGAKVELGGGKSVASTAPMPGPLVALDPVTVNLTGGHYLRIGVTVEFTNKVSATAPPDGTIATDQIIVYFTGQEPVPLETTAGIATARRDLKTKIAAAYKDSPVYDILFTSFVVQ